MMAYIFLKFFCKWMISLEHPTVITWCHYLVPGVNVIEVRRNITSFRETHVHFPASQHIFACGTSASSAAQKNMISCCLTTLPSLKIHWGWCIMTISLRWVVGGARWHCWKAKRELVRRAFTQQLVIKSGDYQTLVQSVRVFVILGCSQVDLNGSHIFSRKVCIQAFLCIAVLQAHPKLRVKK
jgi:hypothetical protein